MADKSLKEIYEAMLAAYRIRDKKQGAKDALDIYEENVDFIEEARGALVEIDNLVDVLRESFSAFRDKTKRTEIRKGSLVSKLVPCGKSCGGCPHGPYLYKVYRKDGKVVWEYLGSANKSQVSS